MSTLVYHVMAAFAETAGPASFVLRTSLSVFTLIWLAAILLFIMPGIRRKAIIDSHDMLTRAVNRIAEGDFSVSVDVDPHAPHREIGFAVNEMAKKLAVPDEMRTEFINNVSHEIQSPLTSIMGFARLLQGPGLSEPDRLHYALVVEE